MLICWGYSFPSFLFLHSCIDWKNSWSNVWFIHLFTHSFIHCLMYFWNLLLCFLTYLPSIFLHFFHFIFQHIHTDFHTFMNFLIWFSFLKHCWFGLDVLLIIFPCVKYLFIDWFDWKTLRCKKTHEWRINKFTNKSTNRRNKWINEKRKE